MKIIACPVAFHPDGAHRRIAICEHPTYGPQLLKSSAPTPAEATATAARILYAMSALETRAALPIGTSNDMAEDAIWHFALCRIVPPVRDRWQHLSTDGKQLLQFSWMPIDARLTGFNAEDDRALAWIKSTL